MTLRRLSLTTEQALLEVLERARAVGFLGPGPLRAHTDHADRFVEAVPPTGRLLDLGSGAGLPGLPVLLARPGLEGVLLDASAKRCAFLTWAIIELELSDRVSVEHARAELAGQDERLRGSFGVVTCRGFGPPAQTVECGAGFLQPKGRLVISEPPQRRPWPQAVLADVGLTVDETFEGVVSFELEGEYPATYPRPIKQQRRQPLFEL